MKVEERARRLDPNRAKTKNVWVSFLIYLLYGLFHWVDGFPANQSLIFKLLMTLGIDSMKLISCEKSILLWRDGKASFSEPTYVDNGFQVSYQSGCFF